MGDIRGLTGQWLGLRQLATRFGWIAVEPVKGTIAVIGVLAGVLARTDRLVASVTMPNVVEGGLNHIDFLIGTLVLK